jgi:hypothetical protein
MTTYKVIVQIEYIAKINGVNHEDIIRGHTPMLSVKCVDGGVDGTSYAIRPIKYGITSIKENKK